MMDPFIGQAIIWIDEGSRSTSLSVSFTARSSVFVDPSSTVKLSSTAIGAFSIGVTNTVVVAMTLTLLPSSATIVIIRSVASGLALVFS